MAIDSFCMIIPTHPPHYEYNYNFIRQINKTGVKLDIYLIFTNANDFEKFEMKKNVIPIILDIDNTKKNIITYKKLTALSHVEVTKYKYIILFDAELSTIEQNFNEENIIRTFDNMFDNKKIYCGCTNYVKTNNIIKESISVFNEEADRNKLKVLSNSFKFYSWVSNVHVYKCEFVKDYLSKIEPSPLVHTFVTVTRTMTGSFLLANCYNQTI